MPKPAPQQQYKKPVTEAKDIFEGKVKEKPKSKPKPVKGEEDKDESLFQAVKGKIKIGGLHDSLKVPRDFTFKVYILNRLKKIETGEKFTFEGNNLKMSERIKKQIQLALNMMK